MPAPAIQTPYLQGGKELCTTGSCILVYSPTLLGEAIREFEDNGGWCNHAASIVRMPEPFCSEAEVSLVEALEHGLTPTLLRSYFGSPGTRLYLFTPDGLTPEVQARFAAWIMGKMFTGTAYAYGALVEQVAGHVQEGTSAMFCSESYGCALEAAGLKRLGSAPAGVAPQPTDIPAWWSGSLVELVPPFAA
jgi:hypothetical protein